MCCTVGAATCSRVALLLGAATIVLQVLAILSSSWLLTREVVVPHDNNPAMFIHAKIGPFRSCFVLQKMNSPSGMMPPTPSCTTFTLTKDWKFFELDIPESFQVTPVLIMRMRWMGGIVATSTILMILGEFLALMAQCKLNFKMGAIMGCYCFVMGGLLQFLCVVSVPTWNEDQELPALPRPSHSTVPLESYQPFTGETGWSHLVATAVFCLVQIVTFLMVTGFVKRFPTMEAMVREIVPGADRKLREHQENNLVGLWEIYPTCIAGRNVRQLGCISLPGPASCYSKGQSDSQVSSSKTKPDICSSNPDSSVDSLQQQAESSDPNQDEQARSMSPYDQTGGAGNRTVSLGQPMSLAPGGAGGPGSIIGVAGPPQSDNSSLAGVSVPITVMRPRPLGHSQHRSIPCGVLDDAAALDAFPPPPVIVSPTGAPDPSGTMTLQPARRKSGPLPAGPASGATALTANVPGVFSTLDSRGRCANSRAMSHTHTLPHPPRQF